MAVFIANLVLVYAFIPFTLFLYEADSEFTFFQKIKSAVGYTLAMMVFIGMVIGIAYGLAGYVKYPTQQLTSGVLPFSAVNDRGGNFSGLNMTNFQCIPKAYLRNAVPTKDEQLCDANQPNFIIVTWRLRVSLAVYIMAIQSLIGWLLFLLFAGVGVLAAPIDWIQQFLNRPTSVITKSEYIRRARLIAQRSKAVVNMTQVMRRQERNRKWRSNLKALEREVNQLEEDEYQLERVFPQGEDGDVRWVLFMLSFWVTGFMGVAGICISLAWLVHIAVYLLPSYPLHPMLNDLFVVLDGAFSLLGVAAFSAFCLYLMVVAMKGNFIMGLDFVFIKLYPMRPGKTLMSAFLVNTGIILTMAPAIIQFCSSAFAVYGSNTDIFDVFGNQVMYLQGISWIYQFNIFLYAFYAVVFISLVMTVFKGRKKWERQRDKYAAYSDL
ncbi:uncharacterized protein HaLaN_04195 [Haematococcus lacustris]|uniref:LIMR family protein n=1 Tax=Haematococcus lacustris TaxID=44745 RepID=A0A699YMN0_HAELA|nr:uncharacterized protein HaLaN_04195 [Haematococcus lacustris]